MRALYYLTILALRWPACGPGIAVVTRHHSVDGMAPPSSRQHAIQRPARDRGTGRFGSSRSIAQGIRRSIRSDILAVLQRRTTRATCAALRAFYAPTGMLVLGALETVGHRAAAPGQLARVFDMRGRLGVSRFP